MLLRATDKQKAKRETLDSLQSTKRNTSTLVLATLTQFKNLPYDSIVNEIRQLTAAVGTTGTVGFVCRKRRLRREAGALNIVARFVGFVHTAALRATLPS